VNQISLEQISKLYRVIGREERSQDLTTRFGRALLAPVRKLRELRSLDRFDVETEPNVIWALRDITFSVDQGEVVGIIGRNGAGKSTLLKILSRITRPTHGRATLRGRVSSLLEVGTGFHPELSGRENILLNGAIIGMRAQEIRRKLDAIIDYSGVEKFLDTPIKRYSSGMKVRLAFAVAAHLEPDILVIDEVLAVGDTEFQQKCLGTMASFGEGGRTVLFVSHNLAAVQSLCKRGIVLQRGELRFDGTVDGALDHYLESIGGTGHLEDVADRTHNGFTLERIEIRGAHDSPGSLVRSGEPCTISVSIAGNTHAVSPVVLVWLSGTFDERLVLLSSRLAGARLHDFERRLKIGISVESLMLMPGHYQVNVALASSSGQRLATFERLGVLELHASPDALPIALPSSADRGIVYTRAQWDVCHDQG
jgi:lipopolysaccharide transport system ATP-binding protein